MTRDQVKARAAVSKAIREADKAARDARMKGKQFVADTMAEYRTRARVEFEMRPSGLRVKDLNAPSDARSKERKGASNRYNFDGLGYNETRAFSHCYPQAVITCFKSFWSRRGYHVRCSVKTDPARLGRGEKAHTVWLTHLPPLDADEAKPDHGVTADPTANDATAVDLRYARLHGLEIVPPLYRRAMRVFSLDMQDVPIHIRLAVWEDRHKKVRLSRKGWDRMEIGESDFSRLPVGDLKNQIKLACLSRNLVWRFAFRQIQDPQDVTKRTPIWFVTRTR